MDRFVVCCRLRRLQQVRVGDCDDCFDELREGQGLSVAVAGVVQLFDHEDEAAQLAGLRVAGHDAEV